MRNLKDSGLIHNSDYIKFPFGGIKDETTTEEGTPVVEKVYGDLLSNIYAYLKDRGINFNNLQDNELNGFQLIQALKNNVNILNDQEKILSKVNNSTWRIGLKFSILVDKYFVFARASEDYNSSINYSIRGDEPGTSFSFSSPSGFKSGDEILIVCDQSGFRAYSLWSNPLNDNQTLIFNIFGLPLSYLSTIDKIWYKDDGVIFSDYPEVYDLKLSLLQSGEDAEIMIYEMFEIKNKIVCLVYNPNQQRYYFYYFKVGDFNNPISLNPDGFNISNNGGNENKMHSYFTGRYLYLSNRADCDTQDSLFTVGEFDFQNNTINFVMDTEISTSFIKTTNAVATHKGIVTFIRGELKYFAWTGGGETILGQYDSFVGLIFKIKDDVFYTNGEVAKKWSLPV